MFMFAGDLAKGSLEGDANYSLHFATDLVVGLGMAVAGEGFAEDSHGSEAMGV